MIRLATIVWLAWIEEAESEQLVGQKVETQGATR